MDTPFHVMYDCEEVAVSRPQFRIQLMDVGVRWDLREILDNAEAVETWTRWTWSLGREREGRERTDLEG